MTDNPAELYVLASRQVLISACVLSGAGALVFNAFPLFLSTIADFQTLDNAQMGMLGTAYLGAFAVLALVAEWWVSRSQWRILCGFAFAGIFVATLGLLIPTPAAAYVSMGLFGLGAGTLFTIGLTILSRAKDAESAFGIKLMFEMAFAGLLMWVMTKLVISQFGYRGFIAGLMVFFGGATLALIRVPENFLKLETQVRKENTASAGRNLPAWGASIALFIQFGAYSAIWGFMERIGADNGLSADQVGTILSLSIVAGFIGAMIAAVAGSRFGHIWPLMTGFLITIACLALFYSTRGHLSYAVGACAVNALIQYMIVYQMGLIAVSDVYGRFTVMIPFALASGGAVGPLIAGVVVEGAGFPAVYIGVGLVTAISMVITLSVQRDLTLSRAVSMATEGSSGQ